MAYREYIDRIDPNGEMGLEFHAARALSRRLNDGTPEFDGLHPYSKVDAIRDPRTQFREGDIMRERLLKVLEQIFGKRTPEQQEFLESLMGQCEQAASLWSKKLQIKGAPSKAKLIAGAESFLQNLPSQTLQGFMDLCPDSTQLLIVPGRISDRELFDIIEKSKSKHDKKSIFKSQEWGDYRTEEWLVALTDNREEIPYNPNIACHNPDAPKHLQHCRPNEKQVAEYKRLFNKYGLNIMPQEGALPLFATQLQQGKVKKRDFWIAFEKSDEDDNKHKLLPVAYTNENAIDLVCTQANSFSLDLRQLPWAQGGLYY